MRTVCVGVAGGSGSGKTTLSRRLAAEFPDCSVVLEQDSYYQDHSSIAPSERVHINYDHPSSIEISLLASHISRLKAGSPVQSPIYDFVTHARSGSRDVLPAPLLLVEGILVLHFREIQDLLDVKVFVAQNEAERLARRIARDVCERGRSRASVQEQFQRFVAPMHDQYVEPCSKSADYVIAGDDTGEERLKRLIRHIRSRLQAAREL
ncbi:MAG: uridine kinase [Armatimonadetes bacterium]|nr:uridine kinase [Armatimonadota bacterium]